MDIKKLFNKGLFLFFGSAILLQVGVVSGESAILPVEVKTCDTAIFGATNPKGLAYDDLDSLFVVAQYTEGEVYLYDSDCNLVSNFDTEGLGATNPEGIAVNDSNTTDHKFAVLDWDGKVIFTDPTGSFLGNCNGNAIGATSPKGITYNSSTGNYAIVDNATDTVYIIDESVMDGTPCNLIDQFSTLTFANFPQTITYLSDTDQYAITDASDDVVYIVSTAGLLQDQFEICKGLGSCNALGITYLAGQKRYFILDQTKKLTFETDIRGTSVSLCDTATLGSSNPKGITINSNNGQIALVDNTSDIVYILGSDCTVLDLFDTTDFGSSNATGIVYLSDTNQLAIADAGTDEIYFVGYDSKILESQCDLAGSGIKEVSDINYVPQLNQLVVTDNNLESIFLLDRTSCKITTQNALNAINSGLLPETTGVSFHQGTGSFITVDSIADDLIFSNFEGSTLERKIDVAGVGIISPQSITPEAGGDSFLVVDNVSLAIYRLSIPLLVETPKSLSGQFTGLGGTLQIFERSGGHFTGSFVGSVSARVFGVYNASGVTITLGAEGYDMWTDTVAADLNSITITGIGSFTRTY